MKAVQHGVWEGPGQSGEDKGARECTETPAKDGVWRTRGSRRRLGAGAGRELGAGGLEQERRSGEGCRWRAGGLGLSGAAATWRTESHCSITGLRDTELAGTGHVPEAR